MTTVIYEVHMYWFSVSRGIAYALLLLYIFYFHIYVFFFFIHFYNGVSLTKNISPVLVMYNNLDM